MTQTHYPCCSDCDHLHTDPDNDPMVWVENEGRPMHQYPCDHCQLDD